MNKVTTPLQNRPTNSKEYFQGKGHQSVIKKLVVKEPDLSDYQGSMKLHAPSVLGDQRPSELLTSIRNLQPVGLRNCGCTVHDMLHDLPYLFVYIGDILVSSRTARVTPPGDLYPPEREQPDGEHG